MPLLRSTAPVALLGALVFALAGGCTREGRPLAPTEQQLRITFLHTSDWHSRLLPYDFEPPRTDEEQGLALEHAPFGGIARMATLIKRERAKGHRVVHVDSGDCFQGAPIFNFYQGEVEIRSMAMIGVDAAVIGNHEFDSGIYNYTDQLQRWGGYPVLAANYIFPDPDGPRGIELGLVTEPFTIVHANGMKVGVIGAANISSISSIGRGSNSLGITPIDEVTAVQDAVDFLEPLVDLVVVTSHMGLSADERIIRATRGIDLFFGGHHHIVLTPPKRIEDKEGRIVPLVHSGAFMKYLGKLDVVVQAGDVLSHAYTLFPVDAGTWRDHCPPDDEDEQQPWCPEVVPDEDLGKQVLPEDPEFTLMIEPYVLDMNRRIDLKQVIGYSSRRVRRFGTNGGDSELGNLVADSMLFREGVEADFALTNSLGIRTDFSRGPLTLDQMFNVFPFENSIMKMLLSGEEIVDMLDFVSRRSAGRGCQSQAQVSGLKFRMNCVSQFTLSWADLVFAGPPKCLAALEQGGDGSSLEFPGLADEGDRERCREVTLQLVGERKCKADRPGITPFSFDVAVNDYIAKGGSGFEVLKFNPSKIHTGISLRDGVIDLMRKQRTCTKKCEDEFGGTEGCELLSGCVEDLARYYERECLRLIDQLSPSACQAGATEPGECDQLQCLRRAADRARLRCFGPLPCVETTADKRIEPRRIAVNDLDGDTIKNDDDNCPFTFNPGPGCPGDDCRQDDGDGDGIGTACDPDEGGRPEPSECAGGATEVGVEQLLIDNSDRDLACEG